MGRWRALTKLGIPVALASLAAACSGAQAPLPTPSPQPSPSLSPTKVPTIQPTATPGPSVVLLGGETMPDLEPGLRAWAAGRGWVLKVAAATSEGWREASAGGGVQAVVGVGAGVALSRELAGTKLPAVLVDVEADGPGERVSVVGGEGRRDDQAAFLAGCLAGLATRLRQVGLVGEAASPLDDLWRLAFQQGLRYTCPRCQLVEASVDTASEAMGAMGVDVVMAYPQEAARTAMGPLAEKGLWVVWVGAPPEAVPQHRLAGGVRFDAGPPVEAALEELLAGESGRAWPYSVESGSVVLSGLHPQVVTPGRERLLEEALRALAAGELDMGLETAVPGDG